MKPPSSAKLLVKAAKAVRERLNSSTQKVGNKKILACQLYQSRFELLLIKYHVGSKQDHQGEEDKIP
jgi:hypothetical protein